MSVRIITDSGSDIVGSEDPRLIVVPLTVTFGTTSYVDGVDLTHERFYELLVESEELPKTSQATPYAFSQAFAEATADGSEVVAITLSSKLSGTYQSAVAAAAEYPGVRVVDGMSAAVGERVLVEYALRLVDEGLGADEIVARLEGARDRVVVVALLDTLEYLRRGGRIPKAVGAIGELLSIRPVIGVRDGEVVMLGKARGSKNGRNLLREEVERSGIDFSMPVALGYTGLSDKMLRKYLDDHRSLWEERLSEDEITICSVGATVGTHVGPNGVAIAFFRTE